jgi:hypothetical protein
MAADAAADKTRFAEFSILGPLEVSRSERPVPLGGPRQRAVLALLLLEANRVVSMDRLAEDLWGGRPPGGWATPAPDEHSAGGACTSARRLVNGNAKMEFPRFEVKHC